MSEGFLGVAVSAATAAGLAAVIAATWRLLRRRALQRAVKRWGKAQLLRNRWVNDRGRW